MVMSPTQCGSFAIRYSLFAIPYSSHHRHGAARAPHFLVVLGLSLLGLLMGCDGRIRTNFALNLEGRDPASASPAQREAIQETMTRLFGTPDEPKLPEGVNLDVSLLRMAAGPVGRDADGKVRGLFRQYCAGCHGISGDGAGPTAAMLNPYPRDYRRGIFKFTTTTDGAKPTREDLLATLRRGIPGTAMPSFMGVPDEQVEALAEYVQYLSIRGETELFLLQLVIDQDEPLPLDVQQVIAEGAMPAYQSWLRATQEPTLVVRVPNPPDTSKPEALLASIARGEKLYHSKDAQCVKCHGQQGRGDGEEKELYDDWNKPKKGVNPDETRRLARLFTLPLQQIRPRDFKEAIFHGGSRPEDLYHRIYAGIKGTPMPPAGPSKAGKGPLAPEEIWDVVNYVRSIRNR
jgi:mono/diheme cytochrome c family protein